MPVPSGVTATLLSALDSRLDPWNTTAAPALTMTYQYAGTSQPADLPFGSFSGWTAFTTAQKAALKSVFDEISSVINVNFAEVTGAADPDFNLGRVSLGGGEAGQGGWSYSFSTNGSGQVTSKSLDSFAVFLNTADLTTQDNRSLLLHEILHGLTLKHPGAYDAGGNIPPGPYLPAAQDSNKYTVMSYNVNPDNGLKSDHLMGYDIAALQQRFGANMSWRTGNDVYTGPAGGRIQTVWDAGGTDTFDGSAYASGVTINLREGAFSSLGGLNNLAIAYGVVIENAIGGSGNDTFTDNTASNVIQGGGGTDSVIFSGLRSAYTLTDLGGGLARVVGPDGTDTLSHIESLVFDDQTVTWTSSGLSRIPHDFNGDGTSDFLWYNSTTGQVGAETITSSGQTAWLGLGGAAAPWQIAGTGDFNGDGTSDFLWYNSSTGQVGAETVTASGQTGWLGLGAAAGPWQIAGTGDFNGDGVSDFLWYNSTTGQVGAETITSTGQTGWLGLGAAATAWRIAGTGDFNGDGISDFLWYNSTTGQVGAETITSTGQTGWLGLGAAATAWRIAGTGYFNGDRTSDFLWYNSSTGQVGAETVTSTGQTGWLSLGAAAAPWQVAGTGDFNSDGISDLLWRNTSTGQLGAETITSAGQTSWLGLSGAASPWQIAGV
jgi:hypothetical protein